MSCFVRSPVTLPYSPVCDFFDMPKHLSNLATRSLSLKWVGDLERIVVAQ